MAAKKTGPKFMIGVKVCSVYEVPVCAATFAEAEELGKAIKPGELKSADLIGSDPLVIDWIMRNDS